MQFGKVKHPGKIDLSLPKDHPGTGKLLRAKKNKKPFEVFVGCAKWNRGDLKNFYPPGTKDELVYYSSQFNCIELNATFYKMPTWQQVETWKSKTPAGFRFFPKLTQSISHYRRLANVQQPVEEFCNAVANFEQKLGMCFLQLPDNFKPQQFDRLEHMLKHFPKKIPLAVEIRNEQWFQNKDVNKRFVALLQKLNISNIIVDTAGRRDMLHMHLTSPVAFIRYVGANHPTDKKRLDDWVQRIKKWRKQGLQKLYFFVHQNIEKESTGLAAHFISALNKSISLQLHVPQKPVKKRRATRKKN